jgi:hypothetical protein
MQYARVSAEDSQQRAVALTQDIECSVSSRERGEVDAQQYFGEPNRPAIDGFGSLAQPCSSQGIVARCVSVAFPPDFTRQDVGALLKFSSFWDTPVK